MKITQVNKSKRSDLYLIYLDNGNYFNATLEEIIKFDLKKDKELSHDEIDYIINVCENKRAYEYALRLLNFKQYTEYEIRKKLSSNNYSDHTIEKVIDKLKSYNFIDDDYYARKYVEEGISKKHGTKKIVYNLRLKGIEIKKEDIKIDDDIVFKNAKELAIKKYKQIKEQKNIKQKIYNYLVCKGYENEIIFKVLKEIFNKFEFDDGDTL